MPNQAGQLGPFPGPAATAAAGFRPRPQVSDLFMSLNARALGLTLPPDETIALAERAGFGGVDLPVRDLLDAGADVRALRARMDGAGLRGGAWPLPVAWRGDAAAFKSDLLRLPRYADAAGALELTRTSTWVLPETPPAFDGLDSPEARRAATSALHTDRLGAIARVLGAYGVRLGLEAIGVASFRTGAGDPFVGRLADLDGVFAALRSEDDGLGVLVDGFHLDAAGEPPEAGLKWGVGRVVWVHVAEIPADVTDRAEARDGNRVLPGENPAGVTRPLLRLLASEGYDGPVTAEPMAGCRSLTGLAHEQAVRRVAEALRSVWPAPSGSSVPPRETTGSGAP